MSGSEDTCCPLSLWCCSAAVGNLQGVERPGSVYSIMPQWWHLMVLKYVATSFHLPSVSTDNTNTVQNPTPYSNVKYQQFQLLWYPRCFFLSPTSWQPFFTAKAVYCLMSLHVCQNKTNIILKTEFLFRTAPSSRIPQTPVENVDCQCITVYFNLLMPQLKVMIALFNRITNEEYWIMAEWNSTCRFRLVFEMIYWRRIGVSIINDTY